MPLSCETVLATQFRPPTWNAVLICCLLDPPVWEPSSAVQGGIGAIRSRGKEMTVTRRGASEMCTSRLTSLSSTLASGPVQRSPKYPANSGRHSSVPVTRRLTPPSIAPMSGGTASWPSRSTAPSVKLAVMSYAAYAATPALETSPTATMIPTIFMIIENGCGDFSSPWRAMVLRPRLAGWVGWLTRVLSGCFWVRGSRAHPRRSGGCGIRTHGTLLPTGFQDQVHRPLGQPSRRMPKHTSNRRRVYPTALFTYCSSSAWGGAVSRGPRLRECAGSPRLPRPARRS